MKTTYQIQHTAKLLAKALCLQLALTTPISAFAQSSVLDTEFSSYLGSYANCLSLYPDGKIVVTGRFSNGGNFIKRLLPNGTTDSFHHYYKSPAGELTSNAIQSDGKIIVGGFFTFYGDMDANYLWGEHPYIARLNYNGEIDTTFSPLMLNAPVRTLAIDANQRILAGGDFTDNDGYNLNSIARFMPDGSLDPSFSIGTGFNAAVFKILVQPDGKILVAGNFTEFNGVPAFRIARLNDDGSLDSGFGIGAGFDDIVLDLAVQPDGKIIAGGNFLACQGQECTRLARLEANGNLDVTFSQNASADSTVLAVAVTESGAIVVGGEFLNLNGVSRSRIGQLKPNGTLDTNFDPGVGCNKYVADILIQPDKRILLTGFFTKYNNVVEIRICRLMGEDPLAISDIHDSQLWYSFINDNGNLQLENLQAKSKIQLLNISGVEILNTDEINGKARLATSLIPKAVYILKVYSESTVSTKKVVVD